MLKVTCSGAYRHNNELVDFTGIELIMPDCPREWVQSNAMNRCFIVQAEKKLGKRIDSIHSLYLDNIEELPPLVEKVKVKKPVLTKVKEEQTTSDGKKKTVEVEKEVEQEVEEEIKRPVLPACCGKKIKALSWEELQDLAMMFCLRGVPLFRSCDLRTARAKAYRAYVNDITGGKLEEDFDYAAAPDLTVPDTAIKYATYKGNAKEVLEGKDVITSDSDTEK